MNDNKKAMRKLRLQVHMSVDGCIAGHDNEMDWLVCEDDCMKYIENIADSVDIIIWDEKWLMSLFHIGLIG